MPPICFGPRRRAHTRGSTGEQLRRLAMLKVWVDNHGMKPAWSPALAPRPLDASRWLDHRERWDDEQIGMLASPPPTLAALEEGLRKHYAWLAVMTEEEVRWGQSDPRDPGTVLAAIRALEESALGDTYLY